MRNTAWDALSRGFVVILLFWCLATALPARAVMFGSVP